MAAIDNRLQRLAAAFGIPGFLVPWVDRFFEPDEIELVLLLADCARPPAEIAGQLGGEKSGRRPQAVESFLNRALKRGIVNRLDDGRYEPADFHARYEIWALFEGWQDIPADIRARLNHWEMSAYTKTHRRRIAALKRARRDPAWVCPEYLLLAEAEALLDRVAHVYLWPCNCRAMVQGCRKPVTTCLRFTNNRGLGWEISRARAKNILHEADRAGLMHSGEIGLAPDGTIEGAVCNCCPDCCFPHRLAESLDARKLWPLSRYVARRTRERCTACGRCVQRCPFDAFRLRRKPRRLQQKGERGRQIVFYRDRCRGCGLCATGCPEDAIVMDRLENTGSLWDNLSSADADPNGNNR